MDVLFWLDTGVSLKLSWVRGYPSVGIGLLMINDNCLDKVDWACKLKVNIVKILNLFTRFKVDFQYGHYFEKVMNFCTYVI